MQPLPTDLFSALHRTHCGCLGSLCQGMITAVHQVMEQVPSTSDARAIGVSGQQHGMVILDQDHKARKQGLYTIYLKLTGFGHLHINKCVKSCTCVTPALQLAGHAPCTFLLLELLPMYGRGLHETVSESSTSNPSQTQTSKDCITVLNQKQKRLTPPSWISNSSTEDQAVKLCTRGGSQGHGSSATIQQCE
jgi:hypothetical protein